MNSPLPVYELVVANFGPFLAYSGVGVIFLSGHYHFGHKILLIIGEKVSLVLVSIILYYILPVLSIILYSIVAFISLRPYKINMRKNFQEVKFQSN
ncbi:hypothetical protein BLA29_005437 [Euroglyphus maynei]|uniref:Uncharacterized protein n=1 Tax=Euroglyphus maynei TaxID=6958 RepID=A0A1Y3B7J6_EURMA|nr:hypothetical protein BLA29_005437 [Euroglyphus maynei]